MKCLLVISLFLCSCLKVSAYNENSVNYGIIDSKLEFLSDYFSNLNSKNNQEGTIILDKTHSFSSQVSKKNTIYIIRSDFDLEDPNCETPVILPEDCVLKFEGGEIRNGCIITPEGDIKLSSKNDLFKSGDVLDWRKRYIYITGDCLISFANTTEQRDVSISSDKKASIRIEGYTSLIPSFHNCCLIKTANVLAFNNRQIHNIEVLFDNCDIKADSFSEYTDNNSVIVFQSIFGGINYRLPQGMSIIGKMIDCTLENVGLHGYVYVDNCTFYAGEHTMHNIEVIHGGGVIRNSLFQNVIKDQGKYSMDIIDVYNHDNVLIDNCKFYDFKAEYLISIKQHYDKANTPIDKRPQIQMCNITIRNCVFHNTGGDCIYIYTDAGPDRHIGYDDRDAGSINILYNIIDLNTTTTSRSTSIFMNASNNINVEGNVFNLNDKGSGNSILLCSNITNLSVKNNKVRDLRLVSTPTPNNFVTFLTPSTTSYCKNILIQDNFAIGHIVNIRNLLPYSEGLINISGNYTYNTNSAFNTGEEFYKPDHVDKLVFICRDNAYYSKTINDIAKPGLRTYGYSNYKEDIICITGSNYYDAVQRKHYIWNGLTWLVLSAL